MTSAECTNSFIQVVLEYNETSSESVISCVFLNSSDTSEKNCCVTHRLCDQQEPTKVQEYCNSNFPYSVELNISGHLKQRYCYTVTASNDTQTVKVEGSFIAGITNYHHPAWHE